MVRDKSVLFIAPEFYNYEKVISKALEAKGLKVRYFPEREYSFLYNLLNNVSLRLAARYSNRRLKQKIDLINDSFDYLLVIRAQHLTIEMLDALNTKFNFQHRIYYQWDSFDENPNALKIYKWFDRAYTFDSKDSIRYNLPYKALFYNSHFKKSFESTAKEEVFDLTFIGSDHGDRFQILESIKRIAGKNGLKYFIFLKMSRQSFLKKKLLHFMKYKSLTKDKVSFAPMGFEEIGQIIDCSRAIIDINNKLQSGLTMRTIEVLAMGKKLITTNNNIKREDFYSDKVIHVIDRDNVEIPIDFIQSDKKVNIDIEHLHIDNWICDFINK